MVLAERLSETCLTAASLGSVRLAGRVGLRAEVGGGRARLGKVAGENRLEKGAEDNLGTTAGHQ